MADEETGPASTGSFDSGAVGEGIELAGGGAEAKGSKPGSHLVVVRQRSLTQVEGSPKTKGNKAMVAEGGSGGSPSARVEGGAQQGTRSFNRGGPVSQSADDVF